MLKQSSNSKFNEFFSNLKEFSRSELFSIIGESKRLLSFECHELFLMIPDEIWRSVFTLSVRESPTTNNFELSLRLFSCVCKKWSDIASELVRYYFARSQPSFSPFVLSRCCHLTSLTIPDVKSLHKFMSLIKELNNFTNLSSLIIHREHNQHDDSVRDDADFFRRDCFINLANKLTRLEILDSTWFCDHNISYLTNLKVLILKDSEHMTTRAIQNLINLSHLYFEGEEIKKDGFILLTNLNSLEFSSPKIRNRSLSRLTSLSSLVLGDSEKFKDEAFLPLTNLTKLELLSVPYLTNDCIGSLTNLRRLRITFGPYNYYSCACLHRLTNLTTLSLDFKNYLNENIQEAMKFLSNVTKLILYNKNISDDLTYSIISNLVNLRSLDLRNYSDFPNYMLQQLTQLTSLTILSENYGNGLYDNGISILTNLRKLRIPQISNAPFQFLTNLTSLHLSYGRLMFNVCLTRLTNLTKLTSESYSSRFNTQSLSQLKKLSSLYLVNGSYSNSPLLTQLTSLRCLDAQLPLFERPPLTNLNLEILCDDQSDEETLSQNDFTHLYDSICEKYSFDSDEVNLDSGSFGSDSDSDSDS